EFSMSMAYLAQPEQQQQLEWLHGGTLAMLLDGKATDGQMKNGLLHLAEGGSVYLPKQIPHGYRITSKKADLLMINTPAGIEGMFRYTGRDKSTPRPDGFEITPERMAEGADKFGQIILGPPR